MWTSITNGFWLKTFFLIVWYPGWFARWVNSNRESKTHGIVFDPSVWARSAYLLDLEVVVSYVVALDCCSDSLESRLNAEYG